MEFRIGDCQWYELKTGNANEQLYALLELLTYAFGYLIIRRIATLVPTAEALIRKRSKGLLDAKVIHWITLGTPNFYLLRKLPGGGVLSVTQRESVRVAIEKVMAETAKRFDFVDLKMDVEVRKLAADLPKIVRGKQETWLKQIKAGSTLRGAVLQAKQLLR